MDLAHEPTTAEIKDNSASPHINGEEDRGYEDNPSDHAQNDIFKKKRKSSSAVRRTTVRADSIFIIAAGTQFP